jgi:1,2-diacylglycerol 3-alpha-glucosyltransferase
MHILIFLDQNPASLGGVQASVLLQQKYLEMAGHKVTVAAPASRFGRKSIMGTDGKVSQIIYPSIPLTLNREYNANVNLGGAYRQIVAEIEALGEAVDVVHVQADWWGALLGVGYAKRQNLPLVNTLHTNLIIGVNKVVGIVGARFLFWLHSEVFGRWVTGKPWQGSVNGWRYLTQICSQSSVVIAPSGHFARLVRQMSVAADPVVIPTGVDDVALHGLFDGRTPAGELKSADGTSSGYAPVKFAWSGRFSHEKRMMEFLQAFAQANVPAQVEIFGNGPLQKQATQFINDNGLADRVTIVGRVAHDEMLRRLAASHALIQTSVGFETQGMTVYEAGVVGTPAVLCDWNIADDLPEGSYWRASDQSVGALAGAIRQAHEDILAGQAKQIDLRGLMYQSQLYKRSIEVYERAISAHNR